MTNRGKRVAFFDVDNTIIRGSTIFFLGRGMYQRGFFSKRDISAFVLANLRYRLTGAEKPEEIAKFHWFSLLARASFDAQVFFSLANQHPVVQALIRADSSTAATYELETRKQSKLPPYYRVAVVIGDTADISKFAENLRNTKNYEITGPVSVDSYQSKLLIRVGLPEAQLLVDLLDDITKVQGVKGRKIFKVRFDPFDL
jgi:hypothetical protein